MPIFAKLKSQYFVLSLLLLATVGSLSLNFFNLNNYPFCFDFDASSEATFVNNLSFRESYDYYFKNFQKLNYSFTKLYAAKRLPFSIPMSWIQRVFRVPFWNTDLMFKVVAGVFGIFGSLLAGLLIGAKKRNWSVLLFFIGICSSYPPLLLGVRTGFASFLMGYSLFWFSIFLFVRYLEKFESKYLYLLAVALAYFLLNAQPPTLVLSLCFFLIWLFFGGTKKYFKDKHLYYSAFLTIILFIFGHIGIGIFYAGDLTDYTNKVVLFNKIRGKSVSINHKLLGQKLSDKLLKLSNQHFLFKHDNLGDSSREDGLWTIGKTSYSFLALIPFGLLGIYLTLKNKEKIGKIFLAVLLAVYLFFLTISFPEGRYILPVVPCYFYFIWRGISFVFQKENVQILVLALAILLTTSETYNSLVGVYQNDRIREWGACRDLKPIVVGLMEPGLNGCYLQMPVPQTRKFWHYFLMLSNFELNWDKPKNIDQCYVFVKEAQEKPPRGFKAFKNITTATKEYVCYLRENKKL